MAELLNGTRNAAEPEPKALTLDAIKASIAALGAPPNMPELVVLPDKESVEKLSALFPNGELFGMTVRIDSSVPPDTAWIMPRRDVRSWPPRLTRSAPPYIVKLDLTGA